MPLDPEALKALVAAARDLADRLDYHFRVTGSEFCTRKRDALRAALEPFTPTE